MTTPSLLDHSTAIESLMVKQNFRGMKELAAVQPPGSYLRAAELLSIPKGTVIIGTGFPVCGTFETDGPAGAIALYRSLTQMGSHPFIACGGPLYKILKNMFNCLELSQGLSPSTEKLNLNHLNRLHPLCLVSIECPGKSADGNFYNMRGTNISRETSDFDSLIRNADCPTVCIGDGGNEIGMGNLQPEFSKLNIIPSVTPCDALLLADVSNWGAYGIIAMLSLLHSQDFLKDIHPVETLAYLNSHGGIDGITGKHEPTEDGRPASEAQSLIDEMRRVCGFN